MEIEGTIKLIKQEQVVSEKFKKRELIITIDEGSQYPQHIQVEFTQDKCAMLDAYKVGQKVKVGINLRGREWTSPQGEVRYFNTLQGWRIESLQAAPSAPAAPAAPAAAEDDNDLF